MRAWACHEYGSPRDLRLDEVAAPVPRAAEVIIATEAIAKERARQRYAALKDELIRSARISSE